MMNDPVSFSLFFERGRDRDKFPKSSQVPKMFLDAFPKMFPIAPGSYPIWFAQSSTPIIYTKQDEIQGLTFVSILQLGVQRGAYIGGMPKVHN